MLGTFCKYLNTMEFYYKMFFFDTTSPMSHTSSSSQKEMTHGYWKTYLCPNHGFSANLRILSMRSTISRSLQNKKLFMLGSVSLHGLCPTYLPRESERYRGLPSIGPTETLSHGYLKQSLSQCLGSRQPIFLSGIESDRLCIGLHPDRFMSFPFPIGEVSQAQRSDQITHPFGSARKHSFPCHHYSWEDSRCDHSGSTDLRIKAFYGTSDNAVKTQIWIAITVYVLVAIVKKN